MRVLAAIFGIVSTAATLLPQIPGGPQRRSPSPVDDVASSMTILEFGNAPRSAGHQLSPHSRFLTRIGDEPTAWIFVRFDVPTPFGIDPGVAQFDRTTLFLIPEYRSVRTGRRTKPWRPEVPVTPELVGIGFDKRVEASDPVYSLPGHPPPEPPQICIIDCFPGDTVVQVPGGTRVLRELAPCDLVLDAKGCPTLVRAVRRSLARELVTIEAGDETIRSTAGHRFRTPGRGWVRADELTTSDRLTARTAPQVRSTTVHRTGLTPVYTLELVDGHDAFRIGANGIVVAAYAEGGTADSTRFIGVTSAGISPQRTR